MSFAPPLLFNSSPTKNQKSGVAKIGSYPFVEGQSHSAGLSLHVSLFHLHLPLQATASPHGATIQPKAYKDNKRGTRTGQRHHSAFRPTFSLSAYIQPYGLRSSSLWTKGLRGSHCLTVGSPSNSATEKTFITRCLFIVTPESNPWLRTPQVNPFATRPHRCGLKTYWKNLIYVGKAFGRFDLPTDQSWTKRCTTDQMYQKVHSQTKRFSHRPFVPKGSETKPKGYIAVPKGYRARPKGCKAEPKGSRRI